MNKSFVVCAFFLFSHFAPAADIKTSSGQTPIENFTRYSDFGSVRISPAGEYIAYKTGKYGRSIVAVFSLKDRKIVGGVRCPDGFEIYDFDWVSHTRLIYRIAERPLGAIQPSVTGEILAIDFDGKKQQQIYGYRAGEQSTGTHMHVRESSYATPELVSALKHDDKFILIAEYPWREGASYWYYDPDAKPVITRLNVYDGHKVLLGSAPLGGADLLVDRNDQVRFAFGHNEKLKLAVSWRPEPGSAWTAFELPGFRDESIVPRLFGEDNQSVLFTGVRDGESLSALYNIDLKSKEVTKVFGFENADVAGLILDLSETKAVGVMGYADKPLVHWLNPDDRAAKIYQALYRAFPKQKVTITSATEDGKVATVLVSSDVDPGVYYLFNTETMKANLLRVTKPWIEQTEMRPKEPFAFKARDGLELHGYVTRPTGAGPFPLVVLPHGGPHGIRDDADFDWEVQLLASRGYAVLQVNFRGSGGYGMDFLSAGYREWGASMQNDVTDATHWAIDQKITQPDRICIYGGSYGGYAALMGAVREPNLYRCAIGYAGVYDLELMLSSADIPRSKSGRAYLDKALGNDRADLHARSPVYNAEKIQIPVLLIHGKEDWRADFDQAKRMKAALESNHKQFEWMALNREGHGAYDEETRREVFERILKFLDQNLKPMPAN